MSKKHSNDRKRATKRPSEKPNRGTAPAKPAGGGGMTSPESIRETIESIVIAFILAFLFRTFEAEAFVIPTGSMAPTLMGRHKDLECPKCGFFYRASASQELDSGTNALTGSWTVGGTCPMCRYPAEIGPGNPQAKTYKSYSGDRILVEKFPYQFRDPERFEVSVFKFPGGAKTNYIKRICGLPNETIRIYHGDLYVKPKGETEFTIVRKKDPKKLLAVLQPVYDTDYVAADLIQLGLPQRWVHGDGSPLGSAGTWSTEDHKSFRIDGQGPDEVWLRYQHVIPTQTDWQYLAQGAIPPSPPARQLIADFTAYNTRQSSQELQSRDAYKRASAEYPLSGRGLHWVGDLALEADVKVESDTGELVFELVEGGRHMQCLIDVATGVATLSIDGESSLGSPKAETKLQGAGHHEVRFSNVDDQLRLWVDGREVEFDAPTTYEPLRNFVPTAADLLPAGIASRGVRMEVRSLRLLRDLYYIAAKFPSEPLSDIDFTRFPYQVGGRPTAHDVDMVMSNPDQWSFFADFEPIEFELDEGEFLALGDNSGESRDSRLWAGEGIGPEVPRDLLIGKALFIYWPHSEGRIPGTNIPFPFFPNFSRMWMIR